MKAKSFMLIAGEASGDLLAAELVQALRREFAQAPASPTDDVQPLTTSLEPRFFGAGGPRMAAAGVDLAFDLTAHSVIGLSDAVRRFFSFRSMFNALLDLRQTARAGRHHLRGLLVVQHAVRARDQAVCPASPGLVP